MTLRPTVERPRALSRNVSRTRQVRRRNFRAMLEHLEDRCLMAFNIVENFETWGGAGFSATPGPGQLLSVWGATGMTDAPLFPGAEIGAGTDYSRGTSAGPQSAGGFWAFTTPGPNTIFGVQPTDADWTPGTFTRFLLNDSTAASDPVISFNRWVRNDGGRASTFNVSYSLDDVTYVTIPSLDYTTPLAADALGFVDLGVQTVTLTGVTVPANGIFAVRFVSADAGGSGNRDEFGIDNLSIVGGVSAPNSPPVNTVPAGPLLGTEDTNLPIVNPIPISVADPDVGQNLGMTIAVNPADGTFTANAGTGTAVVSFLNGNSTVAILGNATQINLALQTLVFVPLPNRYTTTTPPTPVVVTVSTTDGTAVDTDTFNITLLDVNDPPLVGADALPAVNEDAAPIVVSIASLLANDSTGAPNENLEQTLTMSPTFTAVTGGTVEIVGANVVFTPTPNFSGTAGFTYTVTDNGTNGGMLTPLQGSGSVSFTITSINDAPSFTPGANQTRPFGTNTNQSVSGWATAISAGGGETQTLTFDVSNNNNGLFSIQPAISDTGVLTFTPTGVAGTAIVTVVLRDDGGTTGGGIDSTASITFSITISPAGNPPTINTINPVTINEDAGLQTVNFSGVTDGADGAQQAISISASSSNPTLIPNPTVTYASPATTGSLSFTPAADASGTATITVTVTDAGIDLTPGNADDVTTTTNFVVTVNAVNDRPTFTAVNPLAVNEDAPPVSVPGFVSAFNPGPGNDVGQTATAYTVSGVSNGLLFLVQPAVDTSGTLTYQLNPNANGTSTFNLTVTDSGSTDFGGVDTSLPQTFTITVNAVNDRPTISVLGDQTVAFNATAQSVPNFVTAVVGPSNEAGQTMTYAIGTNTDPSLFSVQPSIAPDGTLTYTPAAGQQGTTTIVFTGTDSGGMAFGGLNESLSANFTITINAPEPNLPPTINPIATLVINEDAAVQTVNFSGVTGGADTPAQSVTITATSSNPTLIPNPTVNYVSPSTTGSLSFTPAANLSGNATITVTVRDSGLDLIAGNGDDSTTTTMFLVTVNPVNDQPTFAITATHASAEDAGPLSVPGFATSISAGPTDEAGQALTFNITGNSNPSLFAVGPTIAADGTLSYTAAPNAFGTATINVTLSDNGGIANGGINTSIVRSFTINVSAVNDAPTFTVGPNRSVPNTSGPQTLAGQATAISEGPSEVGQTVTFTVTGNTNSAIFASQPAVSSTGTLTFTPAPGAAGSSTITIVAQDNGGTASGGVDLSAPQSFTITVLNNSPPTITPIDDLNVNENAGPQMVALSGITAGGEVQALSVTATSSNPALIPNPTISYTSPSSTGTLVFASAVGQIGSATLTVTVRDAGFDGVLNTADDQVVTEPFTVTVLAVNDPPVANDQTLSAVLNTPVSGVLTASDPDSAVLVYSIFMNPALGTITAFDASTGAFTYTPALNATGLDLFSFTVSDGEHSDTGTIRIAIQGAQPVVTPNAGDLLVIGTPDPDTIIVTHVSAGVVRVRTDHSTAHYPVTGQLIINSGQGNDYVVASGILVPTTIDLGEGDDYGSGGSQNDLMIGGLGNDRMIAAAGNNVIWGDNVGEQDLATGGNDMLSSLGGNDILYGGGGNDEIFPGAGNDYVNAGQGDDTVSAAAGNDRVFGNGGNDTLYGDEGDDIISGGDGSDTLGGRTGDDILIGGLGGDTINGHDGRDLLFGGNTSNSASSNVGDANDLALMAMLVSWTMSHPAGLASGVSAGNDGSPDSLLGYTGDDDFYVNTNDATSDFGLPHMGTDRYFTG